jgi:ABC-type arginine/histidine transport system permease subunit
MLVLVSTPLVVMVTVPQIIINAQQVRCTRNTYTSLNMCVSSVVDATQQGAVVLY